MGFIGSNSIFIIIINVVFSYQGFKNHSFFERFHFDVDRILLAKEYKRLITSGFLHVSWTHLIFNMISLYLFSTAIEPYLGALYYLVIYFGSLLAGNLFTLFIHRNDGEYSSVGASGAVNGIIFASIALFPGFQIGMFFLPISIPAWLYGLVFVLYSIYGIRSKRDNVGHEAHLAGAISGMLIALMIEPAVVAANYVPVLIILIPSLAFIYIIVKRPQLLLVDNHYFNKHKNFYSVDHKYNAQKREEQQEVDAILEKIHRKGMGSLSKKEKEMLSRYSKSVR